MSRLRRDLPLRQNERVRRDLVVEEKDEQLLSEETLQAEESLKTSNETAPSDEGATLGEVRIAEDVIAHLATKALQSVEGVQPASAGFSAKLGLGRKPSGGVRINMSEGTPPEIGVDAFINTRYGQRIPDVAWDVQEIVKNQLEAFTGYRVKAVNVFVQGIFFGEAKAPEAETEVISPVVEEPNEGETESASSLSE
ncbi:MAG: Asp23/Gls24 family envelope stress response protein [Synergistaceae bacterium]|jgi:uncharacterized alkaline shock family protein YloU|nr:Asp23/Gls24 family envelope stress response protein [Synergistaceae bacterium]